MSGVGSWEFDSALISILVTLYLFMFADFLSLTHFTAGMLRIIPLHGHAGKQKGGGWFFLLACNKQKVAI